jgi:translin
MVMTIETLVQACSEQIEARHQAREEALTISRALVRLCANTIRAAHRSRFDEAVPLLREADATAARLYAGVVDVPEVFAAGYVQDAFKEYVEASLLSAFLLGHEVPSASQLRTEPATYLNGLAEAASELRRAILDRLRRNEFEQVEPFLDIMDEVYTLLITVDFPEALTGGLRRTTDALRAVLERTRGDVTTAIRQEQLRAALEGLEARLSDATPPATVPHPAR